MSQISSPPPPPETESAMTGPSSRRPRLSGRLLLLPALFGALLLPGAPAWSQVWTANLTVSVNTKDSASACSTRYTDPTVSSSSSSPFVPEADENCASTSVLSDDDFVHGGVTYTILAIRYNPLNGYFAMNFNRDVTTALDDLSLCVGSRALAFRDAVQYGGRNSAIFGFAHLGWRRGQTVALSIRASCPNAVAYQGGSVVQFGDMVNPSLKTRPRIPDGRIQEGVKNGPPFPPAARVKVTINPPLPRSARVKLGIGGTATASDYTLSPNYDYLLGEVGGSTALIARIGGLVKEGTEYFLKLPNGVSEVGFTLTPTVDARQRESDETVVLTLAHVKNPGDIYPLYSVGAAASTTITIIDEAWALSRARTMASSVPQTNTYRGGEEPLPEVEGDALTASFEAVPEEHDGGAFAFRVRLSEVLGTSYSRTLRAEAFTVSQGRVEAVEQTDAGLWQVRIAPASAEKAVSVTLAGGRDCDADGAVCSPDGRVLSNTSEAKVVASAAPDASVEAALSCASSAGPLCGLALSAGSSAVALSPAFAPGVTSYRASVPAGTTGVTLAPRWGGESSVFAGSRRGAASYTRPVRVRPSGTAVALGLAPDGGATELWVMASGAGGMTTYRIDVTEAPEPVAVPEPEPEPTEEQVVTRTPPPEPEAAQGGALEASFEAVPEEHDGTAFSLRVRFGEPLETVLEAASFAVSKGRVKSVNPVEPGLWQVQVAPRNWKRQVEVTLAGGRDCGTAGAVCTAGGRSLSNTVSVSVPGPAKLKLKGGRAREGRDAAVSFSVVLNRALPEAVTVDYATADGTASAGSDYAAARGALRFAPGETEKTVSVSILDDAVDEGRERFSLTLSNAVGARIADARATGLIVNEDPLQKAWLSRFGRTVAGQLTEVVSKRFEGLAPGAHVTVAGQSLSPGSAELGSALAGLAQSGASRLSARDLLRGSAFHVSVPRDGRGPGLSAWGRVAHDGNFDGAAGDAGRLRLDGEVVTGVFGADAQWTHLLAGVALSRSDGGGGFAVPGVDSGEMESTMTTVSPYARVQLGEKVEAWALVGWGVGSMRIRQDARVELGRVQSVSRSGLSMRLGALGARGLLREAGASGGLDLALKADAFFTHIRWDAVSGESDTEAESLRMRLALEGARTLEFDSGATLRPSLELGLRHDGGDAESGTGVELGGGMSYADPGSGLSVEAKARMLVVHADSDYEEWGASAAVRLDPGSQGRGMAFSLQPTLGASSSASERLWGARDVRGVAPGGAEFEASRGLRAEAGYGLAMPGGLTGTPNAGVGVVDGMREYRVGWRLTSAVPDDSGFEAHLDMVRRTDIDGSPEHAVLLRSSSRW